MGQKVIYDLMHFFTKNITIKLVKTTRTLHIFLFLINLSLLVTIKSFIFIVVLFLLLICKFVYLTVVIKKKRVTIYSGVNVSLALLCHIVVSMNVWLYSMQNILGVYSPIFMTVMLLIELLCMLLGFLYTRRRVIKGILLKFKGSTVVTPSVVALSGISGYYLSRYVINEASIHMQNILFTTVFAVMSALLMFIFGMGHVSIIYYINKYKIKDMIINQKNTGDDN